MTGTKNLFSSLFSGSAKPDSTASTSSPQKLPDHAKRIREAAEAVDEERVGADLDALFKYISRLADFIKEEEKEKKKKKKERNNLTKTKPAKDSLLVSKNFLKLKDALSEAINAAKELKSGDAQGFLKGLGTAHVVNIGFLVVANAWERYEEMSVNQKACLSLLKKMSKLKQHVKELEKRPESKRGMEASIGKAIELIIEASIACCTQIEASKIRRYVSATKSKEELAKLEKELQQTYDEMQRQMDLCILDAVRQPKPHYPKYPKDNAIQAQQCNQSWSCGVYTKQGLSNEANLLKKFQSEFDRMLTNGEGKPLNISGRPLNTLLLVMFDAEQEFYPRSFPLPLLEESIDDLFNFEMVYFGNHWDQLPKKVADRVVGHAPANRDTKALFQRLFSSVVQFGGDFYRNRAISFRTSSFQMTAEIVSGENGDKYLSRWKYFEDETEKMEVEDFVVTKRGRYLKLKQVAERGGGSPIALLRELFAGGEEEISVSFLKNKDGESTKVGVDELQGKTILLDIRPGNNSFDSSLHALVELYNVEKERFNFEIITVPIMQEDTTLDVSEKFSREVPWLVLQNPWQLTNTTKYFLIEGCPRWLDAPHEWWYPRIMRIIESNGTFAPYNDHSVLRMLHTWGAAAFPFTKQKEEELIQKEKTQMEAIPPAIFLFQHLERVSEQLREAKGQQKMICLCRCSEKEFPNSMNDVLTELSNIIYIIYIPYFFEKVTLKYEHFTYTIFHARSPLEPSKMSSAEMERKFSLSLSEYEAVRFWARIHSLKVGINATDQFQLSEMLSIMTSGDPMGNPSWMFIMNEDGNLITTQGKEIVKLLSEKYERLKLLSEKYSDDIVKQFIIDCSKVLKKLEEDAA